MEVNIKEAEVLTLNTSQRAKLPITETLALAFLFCLSFDINTYCICLFCVAMSDTGQVTYKENQFLKFWRLEMQSHGTDTPDDGMISHGGE